MITELRLLDFKNFKDATLRLGPFTVVVGTNASGKSNIRDAFRFLHGIGRGYTLADIIGGRYGAGGQPEWAQMRGAASEIIRFGKTSFLIGVKILVSKDYPRQASSPTADYGIGVEKTDHGRGGFRVSYEQLTVGSETIYTSHPGQDDPMDAQDDEAHLHIRMAKTGSQRKFGTKVTALADQPALSQVGEFRHVVRQHKARAQEVLDIFAGIRFLDLVPDLMRKPAFPGQLVLGDSGENLPTVLQEICQDAARKDVLLQWIQELTPIDVVDFSFPRDPVTGLVQLALKQHDDHTISAYSASDGTLRFLAMLAALLGKNPAKLYFFEEIDNGIHPSRLKLLLDLIEGQTAKSGVQVVTTTHSPDLLSMIGDKTFQNTSVVFRPPQSDHSIIRPVTDLPGVSRLREEQGLGRLHASGWLEDVLAFEADAEAAPAE